MTEVKLNLVSQVAQAFKAIGADVCIAYMNDTPWGIFFNEKPEKGTGCLELLDKQDWLIGFIGEKDESVWTGSEPYDPYGDWIYKTDPNLGVIYQAPSCTTSQILFDPSLLFEETEYSIEEGMQTMRGGFSNPVIIKTIESEGLTLTCI